MRRTRTAPISITEKSDDSDSDDVFGAKQEAEEEKRLEQRRERLKASALSHVNVAKKASGDEGGAYKHKRTAAGDLEARNVKRVRDNENADGKRDEECKLEVYDMFSRGAEPPKPDQGVAPTGHDAPIEAGGYARVNLSTTLHRRRYRVIGPELGRGMFASVIDGQEIKTGRAVAIKLSRANAAMRRAAMRELAILKYVLEEQGADEVIVGVLDEFMFRDAHFGIVFERLDCSLRWMIRKYSTGIRIDALRYYAIRLLRALAILARVDVVHSDIKPDNVLISKNRASLRLADFGCAMRREHRGSSNVYLAARFYRAPESVLGLAPAAPVDMWATACVLFELYTGTVCFPADNNNNLIARIIDARGPFPMRLLRRAHCSEDHFDSDGRFLKREIDQLTGLDSVRVVPKPQPPKVSPIRQAVINASHSDNQRDAAPLLADLLESMLIIDPAKRITPADALRMAFFHTDSKDSTAAK